MTFLVDMYVESHAFCIIILKLLIDLFVCLWHLPEFFDLLLFCSGFFLYKVIYC